jgi:hypothetical protein
MVGLELQVLVGPVLELKVVVVGMQLELQVVLADSEPMAEHSTP